MRLKKKTITLLSSLLLAMGLTGCSQKFNDVNDTVKLALLGEKDIQLSAYDVEQLPYASIYAQIDNGPLAFMVLAFAESKHIIDIPSADYRSDVQLKWLSADRGMLVTEHGRVVKTHNLPQGNIVASHSNQPDPLALGLHLNSTPTSWQHTLDWQPGYHFGYQLNSQFEQQGAAVIMIKEKPVEVLHYIERVSVSSLGLSYDNDFWVHPYTGKVLKSRQKMAPDLPYVDITLLKPYS
ncbi:YjbF family lipoprotein [Photobacterium sp.]|uniref:YjbF family lipoprotein n=1 Tax=Photobacterium sp. TaxID=660 RepID=UPI00299D5F03|nr:YjbF family lipoprotein [Photobacterium sp.]MDX1303646.1 YjbF family lipoprotein [Photobacterium sp.]